MTDRTALRLAPLLALLGTTIAGAQVVADIDDLARCQRRFAKEGAKFAQRVIRATLECSLAVSECQVQCDAGVFGPPCDTNPPPCCDSDDRTSNATFDACMTGADVECAKQNLKISIYEAQNVKNITTSCSILTPDELRGAQAEGLGFATLNAGCQALDPGYTCTLPNLIACVGGPLERQHPLMVVLDDDQATPLADTPVKTSACSVANVCGAGCPHVKRRLPFTRTYYIVVKAAAADACSGGKYKLVVVSPSGAVPVLVADDVDASGLP